MFENITAEQISEEKPMVMTIEEWMNIPAYRKVYFNKKRYLRQLDTLCLNYVYQEVECTFPACSNMVKEAFRVEHSFATNTAYLYYNDRIVRTIKNIKCGEALEWANQLTGVSSIYGATNWNQCPKKF